MSAIDFSRAIFGSRLWLYIFIFCTGFVLSVVVALLMDLNWEELKAEWITTGIATPVTAELLLYFYRRKNKSSSKR